MTKHLVINVLEPGYIKLAGFKMSPSEKLLLYQLHDVNPKCTLGELSLVIDVPQVRVLTLFKKLQAMGYAKIDGCTVNVYNTGQPAPTPSSYLQSEEYMSCLEMAEAMAPSMAEAYHLKDYNKYSLAATLYKMHTKMGISITFLRRATQWIAQHISDAGFPVLHSPYMLYNKWGWVVDYHKRWKEKQAKPRLYL